jgi:hypothetical protein
LFYRANRDPFSHGTILLVQVAPCWNADCCNQAFTQACALFSPKIGVNEFYKKGCQGKSSASTGASRLFREIQPTQFLFSEGFGSLSILVRFPDDGGKAVELARRGKQELGQSGRRRRAVALASVRRSNCTCRFPAYSFHEDAREWE